MKQRLGAILTVLLIVAGLAVLTQRERLLRLMGAENTLRSPEDVVWSTSDAARRADVEAYIDCFGGALKESLQRAAADMGEEGFSAYLKRLNQELTGIAVSDLEQRDDQTATLRVEFVYRGRNDVQQHEFKLMEGSWKIVAVGDAEWLRGLLPPGRAASSKE